MPEKGQTLLVLLAAILNWVRALLLLPLVDVGQRGSSQTRVNLRLEMPH